MTYLLKSVRAAFVLAAVLVVSGCASLSFEKTGDIISKSNLCAGEKIGEGRIFFSEKKSALGAFFAGKSVEKPRDLKKGDFFISGRRTISDTQGSIRFSGEDALSDFIFSSTGYAYRWEGSALEDGESVPLIYDFYVYGDFPKDFDLVKGYCGAPEPSSVSQKVRAFLFDSVPDGGGRLTMPHRIDSSRRKIPFVVAEFVSESGAEFAISATRDYGYRIGRATGKYAEMSEGELWELFSDWTTVRDFVFDGNQVFQITDKEGGVLYAECSSGGYEMYAAASGNAGEVGQCIKSFIGYLWALDEHNKSRSRLE